MMSRAEIQGIEPTAVAPGGRLVVRGTGFAVRPGHVPQVTLGGERARVVRASSRVVVVEVPAERAGGQQALAIEGLEGSTPYVTVGTVVATGVHQVDSPAYDSGRAIARHPERATRPGDPGVRVPYRPGWRA